MKIIILMIVLVTLLLLVLMKMTKKKQSVKKSKVSQFECGYLTMSMTTNPFSIQFFTIALLFLIFDVEITLLLSFPLEQINNKNLYLVIVFVMTLIFGLLYEWHKGKIKWSF